MYMQKMLLTRNKARQYKCLGISLKQHDFVYLGTFFNNMLVCFVLLYIIMYMQIVYLYSFQLVSQQLISIFFKFLLCHLIVLSGYIVFFFIFGCFVDIVCDIMCLLLFSRAFNTLCDTTCHKLRQRSTRIYKIRKQYNPITLLNDIT